jgi:hypothetical protein
MYTTWSTVIDLLIKAAVMVAISSLAILYWCCCEEEAVNHTPRYRTGSDLGVGYTLVGCFPMIMYDSSLGMDLGKLMTIKYDLNPLMSKSFR